jgi:hypothetical protein
MTHNSYNLTIVQKDDMLNLSGKVLQSKYVFNLLSINYISPSALIGIIEKSIKLSIWPQINKHLPPALDKTSSVLRLGNHNKK